MRKPAESRWLCQVRMLEELGANVAFSDGGSTEIEAGITGYSILMKERGEKSMSGRR